MERITITIDEALLAQFDSQLEAKGYANRSEGLRDAVRHWLAVEQVSTSQNAPCVGCVVYVYNHKERTLSSRLVETQHKHHDIPAATLHLHIDPENCLEATVLSGSVAEVRSLADQITSETGVRHGSLHIIPLDPSSGHDHDH